MVTPAAQTKDVVSFGPFSLIASERLLSMERLPVELGAGARHPRAATSAWWSSWFERASPAPKTQHRTDIKRSFSALAQPFSVDAPVMPQRPKCHSKNRGSRP